MHQRHARPPTRRSVPHASTQVITDIDDTVKSSGGVTLAGIPLGGVDTSVTRNSFYPGVFQFGYELAAGSVFFGRQPQPVAILTARAREFKQFLEIKPSSKLCVRYRKTAEARGVANWGVGPVLYGSVQEWICQDRKGWRKFENFKLLQAGNAKQTRYVFIGDNGKSEKDLEAARMMISEFPGLMRAIFIHAVSGETQPAPLPEDHTFEGVPIYYFRTYATAARKAAENGFLSGAALERVCSTMEADLALDMENFAPGSPNERLVRDEIAAARGRGRIGVVGAARAAVARPISSLKNRFSRAGAASS